MTRLLSLCFAVIVALAGCATTTPQLGPDGKPLPRAYIIKPGDASRVTYSMVDSINSLRAAAGVAPLALNPLLTAAAATHSRDMAVQNRPWHFGSDGSSPILRVQRTGYPGRMLGENISETYETELETLSAWMELADTRAVILDPAARDVGFAWFQEPGGKIWWTLVTGG
ncbi:MAG: CAP domain-containing protein [Albidovulum sp.]